MHGGSDFHSIVVRWVRRGLLGVIGGRKRHDGEKSEFREHSEEEKVRYTVEGRIR